MHGIYNKQRQSLRNSHTKHLYSINSHCTTNMNNSKWDSSCNASHSHITKARKHTGTGNVKKPFLDSRLCNFNLHRGPIPWLHFIEHLEFIIFFRFIRGFGIEFLEGWCNGSQRPEQLKQPKLRKRLFYTAIPHAHPHFPGKAEEQRNSEAKQRERSKNFKA